MNPKLVDRILVNLQNIKCSMIDTNLFETYKETVEMSIRVATNLKTTPDNKISLETYEMLIVQITTFHSVIIESHKDKIINQVFCLLTRAKMIASSKSLPLNNKRKATCVAKNMSQLLKDITKGNEQIFIKNNFFKIMIIMKKSQKILSVM